MSHPLKDVPILSEMSRPLKNVPSSQKCPIISEMSPSSLKCPHHLKNVPIISIMSHPLRNCAALGVSLHKHLIECAHWSDSCPSNKPAPYTRCSGVAFCFLSQ